MRGEAFRQRADIALIIGGASCVWDDLGALAGLLGGESWPGLIIAVNDVGAALPGRLDHWVSLHPNKLAGNELDPNWVEQRRRNGYPGGYVTWAWQDPLGLVDRTCQNWGGGSSGLHGVTVGHYVGAKRCVLAGIPMTNSPHYHDDHGGEDWKHAEHHWRSWMKAGIFPKRFGVRSLSGRTRKYFGAPSLSWILKGIEP